MFQGRNKGEVWKCLVEKFFKKMEGWKGGWLSSVGRLLMLKLVVSVVPIFLMMCLNIPKRVISSVLKQMRSFFWSGTRKSDKILC